MWRGASASSLGIEMALAVVFGLLIGMWLDGKFDTEPLWTLIFLVVGIAAAFKGLIRVARQHQNTLRKHANDDEPSKRAS